MKVLMLVFFLLGVFADDRPIAQTQNGEIRGTYRLSRNNREFSAFEKVPYAQPPIGDLRFRPPQPKQPWTGYLNTNNNKTQCMQLTNNPENKIEIVGTEDCLYLNVYTPTQTPYQFMDVFIYIHGGAFMFGSGSEGGPANLMDHNVVLVTFNYRLGPLGFLSFENEDLPGNNGLKDQVMAIKWVNDNIHEFGGNPESITLIGLSAGSVSVHYHYLSPLSKGLFHRGISMSGTALNNWGLVERPREKAEKLSEIVGCYQRTTNEMLECLRQQSAFNITKAIKKFQPWLYNPFTPFGPVVEPKEQLETPFLDEYPYKLLSEGQVYDVPWITTVVSHEGLYPGSDFYTQERLNYLNSNWNFISAYVMHYDGTIARNIQSYVAKLIADYYWNNTQISFDTFPQLIQSIGDRLFVTDAQKSARLQASINKSPVYFYRFSYRGDHSLSDYFTNSSVNLGVAHTDDIFYILISSLPYQKYLQSSEDIVMLEKLTAMWLSYGSTGCPEIDGVDWKPVSKNIDDKFIHLQINSPDNMTIKAVDYLGYYPFWNSIKFCENEKLNETCINDKYLYYEHEQVILRY